MAVEEYVKQALSDSDDDDDAPLVFRRKASASRQSPPSSAPKKAVPAASNGDASNSQKPKLASAAARPSSASPSTVKTDGSNGAKRTPAPVVARKAGKVSNGDAKKAPKQLDVSRSEKGDGDFDSDDEKPLSAKFLRAPAVAGGTTAAATSTQKIKEETRGDSDDLEDERPLASRFQSKSGECSEDSDDEKPLLSRFQTKSGDSGASKKLYDSDEEKPLSSRLKLNGSSKKESSHDIKTHKNINKRPLGDGNGTAPSSVKKAKVSGASAPVSIKHEVTTKKEVDSDSCGDDYTPISQRTKKSVSAVKKSTITKVKKVISKKEQKKIKKSKKNSTHSKTMTLPPGSGGGQKWTTLEHSGVIFPPPYKSHGVKMLYNGQPVDLTPEQEEVATMFAVMKDTDYASKPKFIENFWNDWRKILGRNHVIKKFELCDFTPIYEWHLKEKEKKKQMSTEEKKALKEEKLKLEEKYMWAIVDDVKEKVGNFRVEPPGLFRGRGEHPKMGKLKRRIRPSDITINIGKDAPVPECPIPGERWKEVKHDNTVTWLAFWNDPINPKEFKYVFLAASSSLKGQSDKEKYEKARLLKDYIHGIRENYRRDFNSKDPMKRQIAVATYLIDKLALRAGNEKDDDEADTVGCCTLKVENVMLLPENKLQFYFLGKDSIRYFNTVEVEAPVYKAIGDFRTAKKHNGGKKQDGDDLFDMLDTSKLNAHLKELMPGLTAKVFRTYNASITLDEMLSKESKEGTLPEKIAVYQGANKEAQREELKVDLSRARKGKPPLKDADGKAKRNLSPEALEKKLTQIDARIEKMEIDKKIKEDLKTVALGTSKINYLDPRITVAWCKRHEVPIEKIFNKSLLAKFSWAMDVDPDFRF